MADLSCVAWLLARAGYTEAGNIAVSLNSDLAHDSRLLGALLKRDRTRYHQERLLHAMRHEDLTRLVELLGHCKPDEETFFAAVSGSKVDAARLMLPQTTLGIWHPDPCRDISDETVTSVAMLVREICARPDVSRILALQLGVQFGLDDIVTSARDGAVAKLRLGFGSHLEDLGVTTSLMIAGRFRPRTVAIARLLAESAFFSLEMCFFLASSNEAKDAFPGAAAWVVELCTRLVGDADTEENRDYALSAAALTGAGDCITDLVARGALLVESLYGCGLLHVVRRGYYRELELLYELRDRESNNLFACVAAGLTACAHDLITRLDWEPNVRHPYMGCTVLSLACATGDVKTVRMLLQQGADPEWRSHLKFAYPHQDPWLMCLGTPWFLPGSKLEFGFSSAFFEATLADRSAIAGLLVSAGSRPSLAVVAEAAREGCVDLLELFINAFSGQPLRHVRRSSPEIMSAAASAALPHASSKHAMLRLVAIGATIDALQIAAACRLLYSESFCESLAKWDAARCAVVNAMMEASPDACPLNARDSRGRTVLTWAAQGGSVSLVRALLAAGANPASTDTEGHSALDLASRSPLAVVRLLQCAMPRSVPLGANQSCGTKRRASMELVLPEH